MGGHLCVWNNCFTLINSARSRQVALQRPVCSDSRRIARRWVLICCWLLFPETMGEMRGWRWQRGEKGKAAGGGDGDDTGRGRLWTKPLWERVCARVSVAEKREGCKQHDGKMREGDVCVTPFMQWLESSAWLKTSRDQGEHLLEDHFAYFKNAPICCT